MTALPIISSSIRYSLSACSQCRSCSTTRLNTNVSQCNVCSMLLYDPQPANIEMYPGQSQLINSEPVIKTPLCYSQQNSFSPISSVQPDPDGSIDVKITLKTGGFSPERATFGSDCFDLFCPFDIRVAKHARFKVPMAFEMQLPSGYSAEILPRSGLEVSAGIICHGIIDNDYNGEIFVILFNLSDKDFYINKGNRIAQMRFLKSTASRVRFFVSSNIQDQDQQTTISPSYASVVRTGGLGSTGL